MTKVIQKNRAAWLSSYDEHIKVIDLPFPSLAPGSAIVEVLSTTISPYAGLIHDGTLRVYNLHLPLVPNPGAIGRIQSVGPDAVTVKPGDLVLCDPLIKARDDPSVFIIQGHHGGEGPQGKKLMQGEWRDGALQQYMRLPLENLYVLDEARLCRDLGYKYSELPEIAIYALVLGALREAGNVNAGDTVIVGPATGFFSSIVVEVAIILGANVIALGRNEAKLQALGKRLGNSQQYQYVAMTGNVEADAATILKATPNKEGADLYNDWSAAANHNPPFLQAACRAVKKEGKIVLSGAPSGDIQIPYILAMHNGLKIIGKNMYNSEAIKAAVKMVSTGVLKLGKRGGAEVTVFDLDCTQEAVEFAAQQTGPKAFVVVAPNGT